MAFRVINENCGAMLVQWKLLYFSLGKKSAAVAQVA
jgi:hypothetical protein